jgi:hypothetical protein
LLHSFVVLPSLIVKVQPVHDTMHERGEHERRSADEEEPREERVKRREELAGR